MNKKNIEVGITEHDPNLTRSRYLVELRSINKIKGEKICLGAAAVTIFPHEKKTFKKIIKNAVSGLLENIIWQIRIDEALLGKKKDGECYFPKIKYRGKELLFKDVCKKLEIIK